MKRMGMYLCNCGVAIKSGEAHYCEKLEITMPKIDDIDTKHTKYIICPYCGNVERDAWEIDFGPYGEGDTEIDCGRCEKIYKAHRECEITYTTEKI